MGTHGFSTIQLISTYYKHPQGVITKLLCMCYHKLTVSFVLSSSIMAQFCKYTDIQQEHALQWASKSYVKVDKVEIWGRWLNLFLARSLTILRVAPGMAVLCSKAIQEHTLKVYSYVCGHGLGTSLADCSGRSIRKINPYNYCGMHYKG